MVKRIRYESPPVRVGSQPQLPHRVATLDVPQARPLLGGATKEPKRLPRVGMPSIKDAKPVFSEQQPGLTVGVVATGSDKSVRELLLQLLLVVRGIVVNDGLKHGDSVCMSA